MNQRVARSRRAFLKTVGGVASTLPFYRLLESSAVEAATQPQRFVGFYAPHGISAPLFDRQAGETDTSFSLTFPDSVLSPFDDPGKYGSSFKSKIVTIQGIDLGAGLEKNTNGHDISCGMLTGCAPSGEKVANESLDQFLAVTKGLGAQTRMASLVLGVGNRDTQSGRNISYSKAGAPIAKIIDPAETYKLLFQDLVVGTDPNAQLEAERRRLRGQSVLDYLKEDLRLLEMRLAAPERLKMEQHLSSLRELEKQIMTLPTGGTPGGAGACKAPPTPNKMTDFPKIEVYNGGIPYLEKIGDLQVDMMAAAMACDITRFATIFFYLTEDVHQSVAHQYAPANRGSVLELGKHNRYFFGKCARLMQRLTEHGIVDNTLIYMSSDMGDPNKHSIRNVPTVLAGGVGGKLKMGRRLVVANDNTSNNKLLVSISRLFGVDVPSYGTATSPEVTTGALSELG